MKEKGKEFVLDVLYEAAGGFRLGNDPYEIIFSKSDSHGNHEIYEGEVE